MVISSYNWDHPQVRGVLFFHHFRNRCLHALQKCQCLAGGGQRGAAGGTPSLQGRPPLTMAPCVPPSGLPLTAASSAEERVETGLARLHSPSEHISTPESGQCYPRQFHPCQKAIVSPKGVHLLFLFLGPKRLSGIFN